MDAVHGLLALANDRQGMSWGFVGKLAGGYQQGAYELTGLDGARAVLKWHPAHLPAKQLTATARAVEDARVRGWPTPRWIAYGPLPADGAYIVEEFVEGERPTRLEGPVLDRLLDAIRLQADARPDTDQDWSTYIQRVVFEGEADLATRMRAHPATTTLQRRLEQMTAGARELRLPANDLVHGDFVLNNMLVRDDVPYVVDTAHAGKGTRAYDLATLLMETTVGGDYTPPSLSDQRRLKRECVALVGRDGFLVCVACRIMHLLVFGGVHWDEHVPRAVAKCNAFLDGLESS
jgi:aminoglycoside phosphotransferase (APT) family kinase protein